ncbi:MAG: Zeta toxin [Myxococcaceae bacterium]|nr:Zeta toxin [Myxococcaceae bacterium]
MSVFEQRPLIVSIAGPNGAGKTTFHAAHLPSSGLRFVNADELARELGIDAYRAAELASQIRRDLVLARESFVFETVFSDPKQDKIAFLRSAQDAGYTVLLCFIGLESAQLSEERVTLRALMGGHDVPSTKLLERYPRSLANLAHALRELQRVHVYDNSVSGQPHRLVAELEGGKLRTLGLPSPRWLQPLVRGLAALEPLYVIATVVQDADRETLMLEAEDGSTLRILRAAGKQRVRAGERVRLDVDLTLLRTLRPPARARRR